MIWVYANSRNIEFGQIWALARLFYTLPITVTDELDECMFVGSTLVRAFR